MIAIKLRDNNIFFEEHLLRIILLLKVKLFNYFLWSVILYFSDVGGCIFDRFLEVLQHLFIRVDQKLVIKSELELLPCQNSQVHT